MEELSKMTRDEIKHGLKEITEGKVVPLNLVELNEKIAKWSGFWQKHTPTSDYWHFPETLGGRVYSWNPPRFVESLDACFEYIVPKLKLMYLTIWEGFEVHLAIRTPNDRYKVYIGKSETSALALCRAVEKLIDGE